MKDKSNFGLFQIWGITAAIVASLMYACDKAVESLKEDEESHQDSGMRFMSHGKEVEE